MIRLINHINIFTQKLAETRDFFIAVGFEEGPRPNFDFPGHWLYADGQPLVQLQLTNGPVVGCRESALQHAGFEVTDLDAIAARLDERGVAYQTFGPPIAPSRRIFVEDPNGVLLELNSPRPATKPANA